MNDPFLKVITSVFLAGAGHHCYGSGSNLGPGLNFWLSVCHF